MQDLKWGRLLVAAVTIFVVGTLALWYEFNIKGQREEAAKQAKRLFNLKDRGVAALTLGEGANAYSFKCLDVETKLCKSGDNSKWEVTAPMQFKADDANVNAFLTTLNNLQPNETIDLTPESAEKRLRLLKEYQLDAAARGRKTARRVDLTFVDGQTQSLVLGDLHPVGESFFGATSLGGKFDEEKIFLIPNYFKSNFERDLTHWRDKKLLALAAHQVVAIDVDLIKAKYRAEKNDGNWLLRGKGEKDAVPGDLEAVDNLLSAVGYLSAKAFVAEKKTDAKAKAKLAGSPTVLSLRMEFSKGTDGKPTHEPVTLSFYQAKNSAKSPFYATVSTNDPLYELDPGARDRLSKELKELRLTKLLSSNDRFAAKQLKLSGAVAKTLNYQEGKWTSDGKEVPVDKVNMLLDRMTGNRIRDFVRTPPAGEANGLHVDLLNEKGEALRSYVFWKAKSSPSAAEAKDGYQLFARDLKNSAKEALLVDKSLQEALPFKADHFEASVPAPAVPAKPAADAHGH